MTALDHIKRALRMLGIIAENETPDAPQGETGLAALNGMLAAWENDGIRLDLAALALVDTIPLPASHTDAISYGLALRLAAEYGADVRPAVVVTAGETKAALMAAYSFVPTMHFDPALLRSNSRRRF